MIGSQIGDIVMDDPPRNTKLMDDMVFNEVNNINNFNFSERYSSVYSKNNYYNKNKPMTCWPRGLPL